MNKGFNSKRYFNDFLISKSDNVRIERVLKLIGPNKLVLDLGCGDGFLMTRMRSLNNQIIGVETAESAILKARKKGFKIYDLLLEDKWCESITEKFDVVFAGEIIEHIFDTDNFLQNIRKVLKTNGRLIITTPNVASLGRRIFLLFGKNPLLETTARDYDAGHIRYFTRSTLKKLLIENDFKIIQIESSVVNFSNSGNFFSSLLAKVFPSLGNNIIVVARII